MTPQQSISQEIAIGFKQRVEAVVPHLDKESVGRAKREFVCVIKKYSLLCKELVEPMSGLATLERAIYCLRPSTSHLTAVHAPFVQLCMLAKCHHYAFTVLDTDVWQVNDPKQTGIIVQDVLTYYYYGGMAYCADKQWSKAQHFFELCMSVPATAPSAIAVAAYKKWILVSLILSGKCSSSPPRTAPSCVGTIAPRVADFYASLARASTSSKKTGKGGKPTSPGAELNALAMKHLDVLQSDGNLGLFKQALSSISRLHIAKQTRTYLTMSLDQIAKSADLSSAKEAESVLVGMIEDGEIDATISQKDGMVIFRDTQESYSSVNMLKNVNERIQGVINLGTNVRKLDREVQLSEDYIKKSLRGFDSGPSGGFDMTNMNGMNLDFM